jgi:hypothetical protein
MSGTFLPVTQVQFAAANSGGFEQRRLGSLCENSKMFAGRGFAGCGLIAPTVNPGEARNLFSLETQEQREIPRRKGRLGMTNVDYFRSGRLGIGCAARLC